MNYDGWRNKETQKASLYLKKDFNFYRMAWNFQDKGVESDIFAIKLKEAIADIYLKEKYDLKLILQEISLIDFKEIAEDFYCSYPF